MAQILLPTREVPTQEKQKESAMDKLLKGLQIANTAFGIGSSVSNMKSQSQARDIAEAKEGREAAKFGLETQRTTTLAPPGDPGTLITLQTPDGESVPQLRIPRPEAPDQIAKQKEILQDLQIQKAKKELAKTSVSDKAIQMTPEMRQAWKNRGVSNEILDMVAAGYGGRNPTNTLNMAAERDEPNNAELNVIKDLDETDLILGEVLGSAKEDWIGPVRGRAPDIPGIGKYVMEGEEAGWRSQLGRLNDAYRKAITGMGASAQEIETLMTRLPGPSDTFDQFVSKSKWLDKEIAQKRDLYLNNLEKGGKFVDPFRSPGSTQAIAGSKPTQVQTQAGPMMVDESAKAAALEELKRRKAAAQQRQPGLQVPRS